ncbi:hypothetical protein BCR36DRAFT_341566 [Piromyces finnis]|uniref:Uncharacterized protein n=1 Tax=Piromyces finnis TaxID=1754191 RepID=A0A1Y1VP51_9FUNG|nr:hypothetical protein BCR36DRAFT_341566 [Piromyces finnis]|eukprot:ORX61187.1 hypothetical protein BCR36DRAFT_341566 [Piromyces finnis]
MLLNFFLYLPSLIFQSIRLASINIYPLNWNIKFLSILHAINGAYIYRKNSINENVKIPFIQGFVSYILMSLGGTLSAGILIGIAPGWIINDNVLPLYFLIYCIFFLDKEGCITKFISKGGIAIEFISAFINVTSRTSTLCGNINMIRDYKDPYITNSIVCLLICGTLSGCGGGILDHTFSLSKREWKYNTPSCLKGENSFSLKSTIAATLHYIILSNPLNEDMVGLFGFIIKCRQFFIGNPTRIQAMTMTWIFFIIIYFIYTYINSVKYSMPQFLPPPIVKFFGTYNLDIKSSANTKNIKESIPEEKENKIDNEKKNE